MTTERASRNGEERNRVKTNQQDEFLTVLRRVLPLAEAYLKDAPSDPRNADLEDARALLKGHSLYYPKSLRMTKREQRAAQEAVIFRLAGETDDTVDTEALRTLEDKFL